MSDAQPRSRLLDRINQANAAHAATATAPSAAAAAAQPAADEKPQGGRRGSSDSSAGSHASDPESLAGAPSQEPGHTKSVVSLLAVTTNFVLLAALLGGSAWVFRGIGSADKTAPPGKPASPIASGILEKLGINKAEFVTNQQAAPKTIGAFKNQTISSLNVPRKPGKINKKKDKLPEGPTQGNASGTTPTGSDIQSTPHQKPTKKNSRKLRDLSITPDDPPSKPLTPPHVPSASPSTASPLASTQENTSNSGTQANMLNNQIETSSLVPSSNLSAIPSESLITSHSKLLSPALQELKEKFRNKSIQPDSNSNIIDQSNLKSDNLAIEILPATPITHEAGTKIVNLTGSGSALGDSLVVEGSHSSSESDKSTSPALLKNSESEGTHTDSSQVTEKQRESSSVPELEKAKQNGSLTESSHTDPLHKSPSSSSEPKTETLAHTEPIPSRSTIVSVTTSPSNPKPDANLNNSSASSSTTSSDPSASASSSSSESSSSASPIPSTTTTALPVPPSSSPSVSAALPTNPPSTIPPNPLTVITTSTQTDPPTTLQDKSQIGSDPTLPNA